MVCINLFLNNHKLSKRFAYLSQCHRHVIFKYYCNNNLFVLSMGKVSVKFQGKNLKQKKNSIIHLKGNTKEKGSLGICGRKPIKWTEHYVREVGTL